MERHVPLNCSDLDGLRAGLVDAGAARDYLVQLAALGDDAVHLALLVAEEHVDDPHILDGGAAQVVGLCQVSAISARWSHNIPELHTHEPGLGSCQQAMLQKVILQPQDES